MKVRLGGHLLVLANVVVHLSLPWVTLQTLVSLYGGNGEALRAFLPRLRPFSKEAYICLVLLVSRTCTMAFRLCTFLL